ncbi:MAG: hypothetical protein STSR0009_29260 [Methanoregula sp.]
MGRPPHEPGFDNLITEVRSEDDHDKCEQKADDTLYRDIAEQKTGITHTGYVCGGVSKRCVRWQETADAKEGIAVPYVIPLIEPVT